MFFLVAGADIQLKYDYLMILYQVVDESTVCLMGHERRQTLALIQDLSVQVAGPEYYQDQAPGSGYCSPGSNYSGSSSSQWSTSSSMGGGGKASSSSSSGQYSPMSTSSSCSPSLSPKPAEIPEQHHAAPPPPAPSVTVPPHKFSVPPPQIQSVAMVASSSQPQCYSQPQNVPTYEIVTSCQPSVMYSNGYYYTSFVPPTVTSPPPPQQVTPVSHHSMDGTAHPQQVSMSLQQHHTTQPPSMPMPAPQGMPPPPPPGPCYTCSCTCGGGAGQWSQTVTLQPSS